MKYKALILDLDGTTIPLGWILSVRVFSYRKRNIIRYTSVSPQVDAFYCQRDQGIRTNSLCSVHD